MKLVISFYPGTGGNRYLNMIDNQPWSELNRLYDKSTQHFGNRYLEDVKYDQIVLTHCVDSKRLKEIFPDYRLVHIKSDLQSSLRREWMLAGVSRYKNRVDLTCSRLEHYNAYKDPSWPDINDEDELDTRPDSIRSELDADYQAVIDKVDIEYDSCYNTIIWHKEYYNKYPLDLTFFDEVIDINGDSNFAKIMKQEVSLYNSDTFDKIWNYE